ncbi:MAG: Hpt domain-containing protein [Rhodoplanes sp.]|uniref:Hpt domain-containing protein n=1 Tax=Rhodoplanes sp. TaxID=1968906 RepID=UPI00180461DB|nr:Hpt domain-containing protein [Rhodoplanes sp.]NVO15756.1 Hpt domain-containing protein [Rhodoplanes sp.]
MLDLSNPAFRAVFDRFMARLIENGDRLRHLEGAIAPDAAEVFAEIRLIVHRLAGSAGTFGFAHLGATAKRLDSLLSRGDCDPELVRALVRQLLAAIDGGEETTRV